MSDNFEKLRELMQDVLLLEPGEYALDLTRSDVNTWDSLAIVSLAIGIDETFGYHPTPDEAIALKSVRGIVSLLQSKGIAFDE